MSPRTTTLRRFGLIAGMIGVALIGDATLVAPAHAQATGTGPVAPDGTFTILREVPTRPAYEPRNGDATWVKTSPDQAFADGLDLGLTMIADAEAATISSGPSQQAAGAMSYQATDNAIIETIHSAGLTDLHQSNGGGVGSIIGSSLDAGLATAGAGIDSAIGSVNGALSGLGGIGQ